MPRYEFSHLDRTAKKLINDGNVTDPIKIYLFMTDGDPSLDPGYLGERLGIAARRPSCCKILIWPSGGGEPGGEARSGTGSGRLKWSWHRAPAVKGTLRRRYRADDSTNAASHSPTRLQGSAASTGDTSTRSPTGVACRPYSFINCAIVSPMASAICAKGVRWDMSFSRQSIITANRSSPIFIYISQNPNFRSGGQS